MLEVSPVNLVQAGGVTLALFGLYLLKGYPHFGTIKLLLIFSALSSVTNFSEEVLGSRHWYLISPVYLLGIGPMFYMCVVSLTQNKTQLTRFVHLLPMFLVLPFTYMPQWLIAMGSVSFVVYGWLIHQAVNGFEHIITAQNSNSEELSMKWFMKLVLAVAIIYAFDFARLNLQPVLPHQWNIIGQLFANIAIYISLAYLINKLLQYSDDIAQFLNSQFAILPLNSGEAEQQSERGAESDTRTEESALEYETLFHYIDKEIKEQELFRQPRLTLAQLAQITNLQVRDISRAINLCAGLNFNDYVNQHRVNAIKSDIETKPQTTLLDIGLHNGFNSKTSFNNVFKRLTGMTPGQFRETSAKS